MQRRSSIQITLVLIGAMTLAGCGGNGKEQRPLYKSKQDCLDDWGGNEKDCQEPSAGSAHHRTGYFYGPVYAGRTLSRAVGMATVARGGFGSSGHFHGFFGG